VTEIQGVATPLKIAFAEARALGTDSRGVLPVLIRSPLFVVAQADGARLEFLVTKSPIPDRMCVTIGESAAALARVPAHLVHPITAERLVRGMIGRWDLLVCYPDGGDVLQAEYLPDLRELLGIEE
jgi:hypothetical protein